MKILLTAFDPFGGETVNPAQEALKQIQAPAPDMELIKLVVPTVFGASTQAVHEAMVLHQPDVVLCIGQAGGRTAITVEQIAINLMDAAIPDNQGNQPLTSLYLRTARMGIFPRFLSRIWWLPSVTPEFRLPSLIPQAHSCAIS